MAIKTATEIEKKLTESAERTRKVREAAEALKEARQLVEQESAQRSISLTKHAFSPLRKE